MKRFIFFFVAIAALTTVLFAAEPPSLLNYQGVLRDASDDPLDGNWDMTFRFYDAETVGNEILIDQHLALGTGAVTVSDGMFNAQLGGGSVSDGSGPGIYTSLTQVFRDYATVYLEISVYNTSTSSWETLSPRIRVLSSAYSLNSDHLEGKSAAEFIDTSSTSQTKSAQLTCDASLKVVGYGIEGRGPESGGYFLDSNNSGYAFVGISDRGINAFGNEAGGFFKDANDSGYAFVGYSHRGINALGNEMGGYFQDADNSGYVYAGYSNYGIYAEGSFTGGYFGDSDATGYSRVGYGNYGITAYGSFAGGYFDDSDSSGYAYVGYGDRGIHALGSEAGGYFKDADHSGYAYVGYGNGGISAHGTTAGGYFKDEDNSGYAYAGWGDYGISAYGNTIGGFFQDLNDSGYARVGYMNYGIQALGNIAGGYFIDLDSSGYAYAGSGDYGIRAYGNTAGGYFQDSNNSGYANVGYYDRGIEARGNETGGNFADLNSSGWASVGCDTYKIVGSGSVGFVQNHPYNKSQVIVYAAPEGDEVATYTRGTARLINGEARIQLGETFKWVTNPDIGLTAYMAPHGDCQGLYIELLTSDELVVRESNGGTSNVLFDYIVYGLRIGFEEVSIVQEKREESWIPSMKDHRDLYASHPELQTYNALERFKGMRADIGMTEALDLTRAEILKNAIHEYDPAVDGPVDKDRPERPEEETLSDLDNQASIQGIAQPLSPIESGGGKGFIQSSEKAFGLPIDDEGNVYGKSFRPSSPDLASLVDVSEAVEAGDVLAIDPRQAGLFSLARVAGDTAVFGIVAAQPGLVLGSENLLMKEADTDQMPDNGLNESSFAEDISQAAQTNVKVPAVLSGVVLCKVDASYGAIFPGDLLTTSATPGHAMRASDPRPGTILGKALEPLESGTGLIKILVMLR